MTSEINCPKCGFVFNAEKQVADALEKKYQQAYEEKIKGAEQAAKQEKEALELQRQEFEEKKKRENEIFNKKLQEKMQEERGKLQMLMKEELSRSISQEYENQLIILRQKEADNEEKLKAARQKELDFMRKEQEVSKRMEDLELEIQKRISGERKSMQEEIRTMEAARLKLIEDDYIEKLKQKDIQLEAQIKLAEEMKRKADQGSMQMQGETHELLLEEALRNMYPFDSITEVKKGAEGADCLQTIRSSNGHTCGTIIYESKNTKHWNKDWVQKLKNDMRKSNADAAILVSRVFPSDMEKFGEKDGVMICRFDDLPGVSALLRKGIIMQHDVLRSQENKGEKMQMLYNYLTGNEFRNQVEAITEGFKSIKDNISKERIQMEKMWKEREKQLEKVLLNTSGMFGSIKGIAGEGVGHIPLLEGDRDELPE